MTGMTVSLLSIRYAIAVLTTWQPTDSKIQSYDNWHVHGYRRASQPIDRKSSKPSSRSTSKDGRKDRESLEKNRDQESERSVSDAQQGYEVVARISRHTTRLEREFGLAKRLKAEDDPDCLHFIDPLEFRRLPARQPGEVPLVAFIARAPDSGGDYMKELVEFGPSLRRPQLPTSPLSPHADLEPDLPPGPELLPIGLFLDFAIGATECCEILHHSKELVHGELRGDAFHFSKEHRTVRLINFGSGARSFENGLTSAGWSSLTSEAGVENRLQFIAPEQTGRMPAEPDTRTDIYSLGILFWTMLTGEPAYRGDNPLEIMQNLLSRRIPAVDSIRTDVPPIISNVIQRMTQKKMDERYQSSSGLKHDLLEIKRLLSEGDVDALQSFKLGSKDVSCFFNLPNLQIGRDEQRKLILEVIENSALRVSQAISSSKKTMANLSSHSSASVSTPTQVDRLENGLSDEVMSQETDSAAGVDHESKLSISADRIAKTQHEHSSQESNVVSNGFSLDHKPSLESRPSMYNLDSSQRSTLSSSVTGQSEGSALRAAHRLKQIGHTEILCLSGAAGLGKSSLLHDVQNMSRKNGYYASAKFDQVKRAPFEPVVRVMSSLFRQIFSEGDVSTPFHNNIRTYIKPYWGFLSGFLDLPPWLLSQFPTHQASLSSDSASLRLPREKCGSNGDTASDWLRAGGSNSSKSNRFVRTFLDVLRLLALQKFICITLDDLQFADEESIELLTNIVQVKIPLVLVLTYRDEEALPAKLRPLLEKATKIDLKPLTEEETSKYVAITLHRSPEYVLPLAAVIQQATLGNPFFVREMLDSCYRKHCIYYSWRSSQWVFDLDKTFDEFASPDADQFSTNNYLVKRLEDLSDDCKSVLSWASFMGNTFSFTLVKRVMSCDCSKQSEDEYLPPKKDPVTGLQDAISAYIIVATEDEDKFRFSHDRYMQAAELLAKDCRKEEMHYIISASLMYHDPYDSATKPTQLLFDQARHICNAVVAIQARPGIGKGPFRDLLYQAAETAREQGARSISLYFFQHCLMLLPDDPWRENSPEGSYQETLTLMTKAAASYWYLGFFDEAEVILTEIMSNATAAADKTPAFIIQSRMHAQKGNSHIAFLNMKRALADLGIEILDTTFEECDKEFHEIVNLVNISDRQLFEGRDAPIDRNLFTTAAVMIELLSAGFWTDDLLFYYLTLKMMRLFLDKGLFPQIAVGFVHLASIAIGRFEMIEQGVELGNTALKLFDLFDTDSYTIGRGVTLHSLFLGHFVSDIADCVPMLERGMEATVLAGDKLVHLLNAGVMCAYKLWSSHNFEEIGAFVQYQFETFPEWPTDLRGGVFLISVRQWIQALQGRTNWREAAHIFDDDFHRTQQYVDFIQSHSTAAVRPLFFYNSYRIAILYRFGYWREALVLSESVLESISAVWCIRHAYYCYFYIAMAMVAKVREEPNCADRENVLKNIYKFKGKIETASRMNESNFAVWLHLLRAEIADIEMRSDVATLSYEAAIDHTVVHGLLSDEALCYELYGEYLVRRGATRPARAMIRDASAAYRRISATAKADHVREKHEFLLLGSRTFGNIDAGTQTIENENISFTMVQNETAQTSGDRTNEWLTPSANTVSYQREAQHDLQGGFSAVGLDMIDLASILESSQLLSSELRVDKLLAKLTNIIVDSTGAALCGLVVNDDEIGWNVAAVGGPDISYQDNVGQPIGDIDDPLSKQITFYVLRFKEELFLRNVLDDERFANMPASWRQKYPEGKAVIALPILHGDDTLLGSIYIEGPPNSLSQRNITVLRMLVNQISISIANALLFKKVQKVSASNSSMLEVQRQALEQAREAERKAKVAEAKAMEMVKLKEEAAKAKAMFLANVSHELRTPLNGVIGMSELLKGTHLNTEQEGYADSIRVCADTLLSVINDILDFSKLEADKMAVYSVQLSLTQTISEVVRALSYTNLEKGLQTVEKLEMPSSLLVMSDPVRLHQILMNLLSNAYKFTAKGTVTIRAFIEHETEDTVQVTCSVTDTGIGITEEQRKKLFQPFSQADSSTARSYGGTGLGLSICKAIIEKVLHGRIWLESEIGVGTTVSFSLPFQKIRPGAESGAAGPLADTLASMYKPSEDEMKKSSYTSLAHIPRDKLRICIAEDNPVNSKIAVSFVKKLGFKCEAYGDGQQAVDALALASKAGTPFHLVLMDVQMPVLDGYNATRAIRAHTDPIVREVLVIAMTASAIRGDKEKCLEAGMNNYLAKPVRANVLKQMLEGYLNQVPKTITNLQQQANMLSQEVLSEASMYKPASTAAAPPTVVVDDVDGVDGQRDGQETPRPASVNAAAGALPALPALPTRKRP
jgi:signal transduction histidine kinase/predicted ATPase/serine/threonine protein kinase/DNA-binding NarL/FixJ family response regulator